MVIDLGKHARNVDVAFVEGADSAYTCEGGAELFKDRRFGIGFETFDFASTGEVETCDVDAEHQETNGENNYIGRDENTRLFVSEDAWWNETYLPCYDNSDQAE